MNTNVSAMIEPFPTVEVSSYLLDFFGGVGGLGIRRPRASCAFFADDDSCCTCETEIGMPKTGFIVAVPVYVPDELELPRLLS